MRRGLVVTLILVVIAAVSILVGYSFLGRAEPIQLKIFCAGSLTIPLEQVAEAFESENPGVKVVIEPSGSVLAIRKIIELNKSADVLAVADYRLIPKLMIPNYADFYISFASNEMVLAYTDKSRYSDEISSDNWFKILMRRDVKYGFSNPNDDPCGYRSLMVFALAENHYQEAGLFERLIADKSSLFFNRSGGEFFIYVPLDLGPKPGSNLVIRSKSVDLIALLEAGALDYALEYESVAVQHGLKYIELPAEVALSDPRLDELYQKIHVYLFYGTEKQREIVGQSIVYGLTIPKSCRNEELAIKFVNFLLSDVGRDIFDENGQRFLEEFEVSGEVPADIELEVIR